MVSLTFWVPYYTPVNEDEQNFYIGKFVQELRVERLMLSLKEYRPIVKECYA